MSDESSRAAAQAVDAAALQGRLRRRLEGHASPWLHAEVARRMAERLPLIRLKPDRIVQWWAHADASDALLAAAYPKARRVWVEPTPALREQGARTARRSWWPLRRARAAEVVLERDVAPVSCELLWANMLLHAVPDLAALFARWQRALAPGGFVMCSGLGPDTLRELRALYARCGWGAATQDFIDMHDVGDLLVAAGFADPVMDQERLTLTYAGAHELLADLRSLGGNASPARQAGLRTPRWRERLLRELDALRASDGRIAMSFEIVHGHAFKAAPRAAADGTTSVSLDEMRAMVRRKRGGAMP